MLIGCFNITLYSYFDIHRIFDLISYRLWDFIIWWFDIDFVLFDFNFDFILCLSYLFLFLIHFFLKLIFSFLLNFINVNTEFKLNIYKTLNIKTILLNFISYLLIIGLHTVILYIELLICTDILIFNDFVSFSHNMHLTNNINYNFINTKFINFNFILFYYIIHILYYLFIIVIRFFFSYGYIYHIFMDIMYSNKYLLCTQLSLKNLFLMHFQYTVSHFENLNFNIYLLNINILFLFSMLILFYIFIVLSINSFIKHSFWLCLKNIKHLFNLSMQFSFYFTKSIFADITYIYVYVYIIFLVNYTTIFIKDFNSISFNVENFILLYIFSRIQQNFNSNVYIYYKKQLQFLNFL